MKERTIKIFDVISPFDFDLTARIFLRGDKQIQAYSDGEYFRVLRMGDKLLLASVRSVGTVDDPKLLVKLGSNNEISKDDVTTAKKLISEIFDVTLDLGPFYQTVASDKIMAKIVRKLNGLKICSTPTAYEALVSSIVEQQISLNVALNIERKLIKKFGEKLTLNTGECEYYAFPTPEKLSLASLKQFRACGLSTNKAEYIRGISKLLSSHKLDLEKMKTMDDRTILKDLLGIRGVGVWTAELTMIRGMQKYDTMPADDLGLRRCIAGYYTDGKLVSSEQARAIADKWEPWRGYASFYLIVAEMMGVEAKKKCNRPS
jgi:DNA-3-methyladenine glycosylase II